MEINTSILIMSQVILKEFVNTEQRLPEDNADVERMTVAILKTYKSALNAQAKINLLK